MGANLNTVDGHIDAIKRWRDVYNSGQQRVTGLTPVSDNCLEVSGATSRHPSAVQTAR
jgi:hypothetical protein